MLSFSPRPALAALFSLTALHADTRMTAKYTSGGHSTETTLMIQSPRQRYETGSDSSLIIQPDQQRMIEVNDKSKTYRILPLSAAETATPDAPAAAAKKGGVVLYRTTLVDTGERRPAFGQTARHIKSVMVKEPGPGACDAKKQQIETDGWYIDLPTADMPGAGSSSAANVPAGGCQDEIKQEMTGDAKLLGYPVEYTMTTTAEGGKPETVSMQVTALSQTPLAAALFDVPAGYQQQGAAMPGSSAVLPKKEGVKRVGAVLPQDKANSGVNMAALQHQFVAALGQANVDAVSIMARTPEEAVTMGKQAGVDYLVYTDVADMKKAGVGKVGGFLKKLPVGDAGKESVETRVDYRLVPVDGGAPLTSGSAVGKTGGMNWRGTFQMATTVASFTATRYFLFNPQLLQMYSGMQPGMMGSPMQSMDPLMGGLLRFSQRTKEASPVLEGTSEATAANAAMQQAVKAVAAAFGK